ncbi:flagellar FliL protein [Andreprevotia lacus DSM 23236]|jgi:flagellar FliL protein|uniref:Flagellar protein FliL n=1 Tax=Andreprevotia lacus DSM 23236 TaxID=1121001 RepID=A0A1W1XRL8_9NEIS|nr:flagellar basal body-associated FliL family protein [Andreprevotia lacus]SMC26171.1 flagellar FliL protein [Andreprevotia lacus DSM 23236]
MAEAKSDAPKGKKNFLLIIVIVLLLVLLLVVGGVAAFLLMGNKDASVDEAVAEAAPHGQEAAKPEKKKKKEEKKDAHPPVFEKLQQVTVNLSNGDQSAVLQTDISLEVADSETSEKVKQYLPKIQGQINLFLSAQKPDDARDVSKRDKLGKDIRKLVNKILGVEGEDEGVLSVNFTTFIVQ